MYICIYLAIESTRSPNIQNLKSWILPYIVSSIQRAIETKNLTNPRLIYGLVGRLRLICHCSSINGWRVTTRSEKEHKIYSQKKSCIPQLHKVPLFPFMTLFFSLNIWSNIIPFWFISFLVFPLVDINS